MKNKKGSILVFALIILSFILLAAFSISAVSLVERRSADISVNSSTAFQNSDKGMEEFLQQLYKGMDQLDTLNDLATELGVEYKCYGETGTGGTTGGGPARIGSQDTEFIITAYKNKPPIPGQTEWEAVSAITDCSEAIADVAKFRATGNHNNAARAVFLKLRDSLTRGLVAHWSFEDRAQNERVAVIDGDNRNSVIAMNSSKYDYPLTLCDIYSSDEVEVNVGDTDGDGNNDTHYVVEFTGCSYDDVNGMNPYKYDADCDDDTKCSTDGSWVPGVVQEGDDTVTAGIGTSVAAHTEAIYFSGDDVLTAFLEGSSDDPNNCHSASDDCDVTLNYVNTVDSERLDLDDGIAISAWFKRDDPTSTGTIVAKWDDGDKSGYKLTADGRDICLEIGNGTSIKEECYTAGSSFFKVDEWVHIVGVWRENSSDNKIRVYINGYSETTGGEIYSSNIGINNIPVSIGAELDNNMVGSNYFEGAIDDVRIWNRALTSREIERLCNDGAGDTDRQGTEVDGGKVPECAPVGNAAGGGGGAP